VTQLVRSISLTNHVTSAKLYIKVKQTLYRTKCDLNFPTVPVLPTFLHFVQRESA